MTLTITQGLPGSGKSTWARQQVLLASAMFDKPVDQIIRVNRDDIRHMLFNKYWDLPLHGEQMVSLVERGAVKNALLQCSVIVDATHLHTLSVREWRNLSYRTGHDFQIQKFEVPIEEVVRRDAERRENGQRAGGEKVIRDMAAKWGIGPDGKIPDIYKV